MSGAPAGGAPDEEETTGAFRRSRGRVSARFTAAQAVILRNLVSQVAELMGTVAEPGAPDPTVAGSPAGQGSAGPAGPVRARADPLAEWNCVLRGGDEQ